jgi:hypothetical protein
MRYYQYYRFSGLLILFILVISYLSCSNKGTLSPGNNQGDIEIVIRVGDSISGILKGDSESFSEEIIEDDKIFNNWIIKGRGNNINLNDFDGEVVINVYKDDGTLEASTQFSCQAVSGGSCNGSVTVPVGDYQVEARLTSTDNCLTYSGINRNVHVVEGANEVEITVREHPSISLEDVTAPLGDYALVPLTIVNCEDEIAAFQFDLIGDNTIITFSSAEVASRVTSVYPNAEVYYSTAQSDTTRYVFYVGTSDSLTIDVIPAGEDPVINLNFYTISRGEAVLRIEKVIISDSVGEEITDYTPYNGTFTVY